MSGGDGRGLGVLSVHFDDEPCAVACPFCYLGAREAPLVALRRRGEATPLQAAPPIATADRAASLQAAVARLDYAELAIALSEPIEPVRARLAELLSAASARGRATAITTTPQIVLADPSLLRGVDRLNLSVDPWKLPGDAGAIVGVVRDAARAAREEGAEVIAIATLSTPSFAEQLIGEGLLEALIELPEVGGVALNALKPPPPFCDRAFWLRALARLRPLLERTLDRKLHLDCYVAARLLGIGGCPARPDLSPAQGGALAFRACVYAPRPTLTVASTDELERALVDFTPPAVCPFDTRL